MCALAVSEFTTIKGRKRMKYKKFPEDVNNVENFRKKHDAFRIELENSLFYREFIENLGTVSITTKSSYSLRSTAQRKVSEVTPVSNHLHRDTPTPLSNDHPRYSRDDDAVSVCRCEIDMCSVESTMENLRMATSSRDFDTNGSAPSMFTCDEVVCYGIGSVSQSINSLYQLAFLLLILSDLTIERKNCLVYDPCFTADDVLFVTSLGCRVLNYNEEGKRSVEDRHCLFFLPHCGKALFNNLLWSNWSAEKLSRLAIIGNSFQQMIDSVSSSYLRHHLTFVDKISPYVVEQPIDNCFRFSDIFNDMSIHVFPPSLLSNAPDTLWTVCASPTYDSEDLEIVMNSQPDSSS